MSILTIDLDWILDERQCLSVNELFLIKAKEVDKIIKILNIGIKKQINDIDD